MFKAVEIKAKETVIPQLQLDMRAASPAEALEAISTVTGINIFYKPAKGDQQPITLALKNISASEALKYVTKAANLKFTYKENGVHVTE